MTPDVNVVVAASRSDHPQHRQSMAWLNRALLESAQGASFKLLPMVVASTLRLVTHPKIFIQPTPIEEAIAFIDAVLAELKPMQERAAEFARDPVLVKNIIADGCKRAQAVAEETLVEVRAAIGLGYNR